MMLTHKKLIRQFTWILFASSVGIGLSYIMFKGGALAYVAIYNKTQELINSAILAQNIPSGDSIPVEKIINSERTFEKTSTFYDNAKNTVSIGFVGDIIPGADVSSNIFSNIISYTEKPDIMIGNFEGVATSSIYFKCKSDPSNCFSFNGDNKFLKLLSLASFDVLNIANNHFNDYGEIGQDETIKEIKNAGIMASGAKDEITYLTRKDIKIGIIGFSTYPWASDMNDAEALQELIKTADLNADIVIVIFHGGGEGVKYSHTPMETEWYLGENRGNVRSFSHDAIDAGSDIVLGSGPHVLRGIEKYKDKLIVYSLGNFASANDVSISGANKTSAMIALGLDKNGSLVSGAIYPFEIDEFGIPHPDLNNRAISTINELSKSDFGEQGITLSPSGEIILR